MNNKFVFSSLYIEITSCCNRKCPYCYNDSFEKGIFLKKEAIFNLIDESKCQGNTQITISGGEPFMHPDIFEIIDYANHNEIHVRIITNLSFLSLEKAIKLLQRGNYIQLTLDDTNETENDLLRGNGSYRLISNLLSLAKTNNVQENISLRMNLNKRNSTEKKIDDFINFAIRYKLSHISITLVAKTGRGMSFKDAFDYNESLLDIVELIHILKKKETEYRDKITIAFSDLEKQKGCVLFKNGDIRISPRIDPFGNVFVCSYFFNDENSLGNIHDKSIQQIIASEKAMSFLQKVRSRIECEDCKKCLFNNVCMCGCPAISYMHTGDLLNKNDQCAVLKYFFKQKLLGV